MATTQTSAAIRQAGTRSSSTASTPAGCSSVEGGHATSDVVIEKVGADHIMHKHIAGVKYEDITVNCGTGMSKGFYEWIKASFDHKLRRARTARSSPPTTTTRSSRALNFFNALITEIGFPALDAASKDAAKMTIKFAPEYTRMTTKTGGATVAGAQDRPRASRRSGCRRTSASRSTVSTSLHPRQQDRGAHDQAEGRRERRSASMRDYEKEPAQPRDPEPGGHPRRVARRGVLRRGTRTS